MLILIELGGLESFGKLLAEKLPGKIDFSGVVTISS
jgi:hypothetical protein